MEWRWHGASVALASITVFMIYMMASSAIHDGVDQMMAGQDISIIVANVLLIVYALIFFGSWFGWWVFLGVIIGAFN